MVSSPLAGGLSGKHIVITRPRSDDPQDDILERHLSACGARVTSLPLVEILPKSFAMPEPAYDWLFFTSKNAVRAFFANQDAHQAFCQQLSVAVVGPATAQSLVQVRSEPAAFISPQFDAEGAARAFREAFSCPGLRILWPCGNLANRRLSELLAEAGARVEALEVYGTALKTVLSDAERAILQGPVDLLVFTSPSAVSAYAQLMTEPPEMSPAIACLGPKTREASLRAFREVAVYPQSSTLEALAHEIQRAYKTD